MFKFNEIPKNSFVVLYAKTYAKAEVSVKNIKVPIEYEEDPSSLFNCKAIVGDDILVDMKNKWIKTKVIPDSPEFREALAFEFSSYPYKNNFLGGFLQEENLLGVETIKVYYYDGEKLFEVSYVR